MRNSNYNIDPSEIAKFSQSAAHWWDVQGELKTLHEINPLRLDYINQKAALAGKNVIDIGCGGGILSESMAKLGAHVTGIDMSEAALNVAKLHQHESGTQVDYHLITAEAMAEQRPGQYDVVTCLEMLTLPSEKYLAEQMMVIDVDAIHAVREFVTHELAVKLKDQLRNVTRKFLA